MPAVSEDVSECRDPNFLDRIPTHTVGPVYGSPLIGSTRQLKHTNLKSRFRNFLTKNAISSATSIGPNLVSVFVKKVIGIRKYDDFPLSQDVDYLIRAQSNFRLSFSLLSHKCSSKNTLPLSFDINLRPTSKAVYRTLNYFTRKHMTNSH